MAARRAASSTEVCSGRPKWFAAFIARWTIKAQAMVIQRKGIVFLEPGDALVGCKCCRSNVSLRLAQTHPCLLAVFPNLLHQTNRKDLLVLLVGKQRPIGVASPAKHRDCHLFPLNPVPSWPSQYIVSTALPSFATPHWSTTSFCITPTVFSSFATTAIGPIAAAGAGSQASSFLQGADSRGKVTDAIKWGSCVSTRSITTRTFIGNVRTLNQIALSS